MSTVVFPAASWFPKGGKCAWNVSGGCVDMPDEQELEKLLEQNMEEQDEQYLLWEQHEQDENV